MSDTLQRILNNLPDYIDKDLNQSSGIFVSYFGTSGYLTIKHHRLSTTVQGGSGVGLSIDLTGYTIGTLVTYIGSQIGYKASLRDSSTASTSALSLIDVSNVSIIPNPPATQLMVFTNDLITVLMPMVWAIEDTEDHIEALMPGELNINTADTLWLEAWGSLYGNIARQPSESDAAYSVRIKAEVTRSRLAKTSIENSIFTELGIHATITDDQYNFVWVIGDVLGDSMDGFGYKILVDRGHERNQFWVNYDGPITGTWATPTQTVTVGPSLILLVERNRAAGYLAHYHIPGLQGYATGPPTYGQWTTGDIFLNNNISGVNPPVGWVCVDSSLPEPGTWYQFGLVSSS